jgi:CheY-like chemotaxis protein
MASTARWRRLPTPVPRPVSSPAVLLVDANEDSRLIYAAALRHYGLSVVAHECSALAVELARAQRPGVIVLGLSFASGPGWVALRALKEDPATASIPIVAVSTTGLPEHRERALAMGCAAFLVKPLPPLELIAVARGFLEAGHAAVA